MRKYLKKLSIFYIFLTHTTKNLHSNSREWKKQKGKWRMDNFESFPKALPKRALTTRDREIQTGLHTDEV